MNLKTLYVNTFFKSIINTIGEKSVYKKLTGIPNLYAGYKSVLLKNPYIQLKKGPLVMNSAETWARKVAGVHCSRAD